MNRQFVAVHPVGVLGLGHELPAHFLSTQELNGLASMILTGISRPLGAM
jgi:hypothetical protein